MSPSAGSSRGGRPASRSGRDADLAPLSARLDECLLIDRARLGGRLKRLRQGRTPREGRSREIERIGERIEASVAARAERRASVPGSIGYPEDLPIAAWRVEIAAALRDHQVIVVCGETGSGKTTQLPKICLELGRGVDGMIGHTQPRRIAARSVAGRIADELGVGLGGIVGYQVRFGDRTDDSTLVKLMTDGILLAETQSDRALRAYDTLIIDEAHERSLNIDFLLGYVRRILPRRPDLRVIVTSATIDPARFSEHFDAAPIIEVSGRTYPVEVRYRPLQGETADEPDRALDRGVVDAIEELAREDQGDVLVFLPGEREIREALDALRGHQPARTEILPLLARLSEAEQNRIFHPKSSEHRRRIVLATNVAETSLTVPGIRCVVDSGLARVSRYSARRKVQLLPVERISQASAAQRAGRCGRLGPGVCVRLYAEDDFDAREPFTSPEIVRANLASVILQMHALELGAIEDFPFIDPPKRAMVRDGVRTLQELGALDGEEVLTDLGRQLARLPVDPRIGRMILQADREDCLREVLVIASALAVQDPRERPMDRQQAADEAHERFRHESSDFLSYLSLWEFWHERRATLSWSKLRKACVSLHLSFVRMREWVEVHGQVRRIASEQGLTVNAEPAPNGRIHRALLAGLISNVARKNDDRSYEGAGGKTLHVFPGSSQFEKSPKWIMAAELVETSRLYARTVARIKPEWLEDLAPHLVQRSYSNPRWDPRSGTVIADMKVSLYGLEIIPKRRAHYGPIDPVVSRELFIYHALAEGEWIIDAAFFDHNRRLVQEIEDLQARTRRRDLLADASARYAFYDARVPADVYSGKAFERWLRKRERQDADVLKMTRQDLLVHATDGITRERFPDALDVDGHPLALEYALEPGETHDGVTLVVPVELVDRLDPHRLRWLVPGHLQELVVALVKGLPKALRSRLIPAPDVARAVVERLVFGVGPLAPALREAVLRVRGVEVPEDAWSLESVPDWLRMNLRVVDAAGTVLAEGRDLDEVRRRVRDAAAEAFESAADDRWRRTGLEGWPELDLTRPVPLGRGGIAVTGHPALVDEGDTVGTTLAPSAAAADAVHRGGVRRLILRETAGIVRAQTEVTPGLETMRLDWSTLGAHARDRGDAPASWGRLETELDLLVADRAFLGDDPLPRTEEAMRAAIDRGFDRIVDVGLQAGTIVRQLLEAHRAVQRRLSDPAPPQWAAAIADVHEQLDRLLPPGFMRSTPYGWLAQVPRYLRGIEARLERLPRGGYARDDERRSRLEPHWRACMDLLDARRAEGGVDPHLAYHRWLLEEFRVALFAEHLGTAVQVSEKRLDEHWRRVAPGVAVGRAG